MQQFDEAERLTREELALRQPHQDARPGESLAALSRLTLLHLNRHEYDPALVAVEQLVAFAERLHGANHPNIIPYVEQAASVRIGRGDLNEAELLVERAVKLRERKFGATSDELVEAFETFGNQFHESGHFDLGSGYFERASNIRDRNSHALFV